MKGQLAVSQLPRPPGIQEVDIVYDIGAGLRPMGWYKPAAHVCIEPHQPYAEMLRDGGYEVWGATALEALASVLQDRSIGAYTCVDAVYLLDIIEHMTRCEGLEVLRLADLLQPKQIVVATPVGFFPQEGDAWGLGGEQWQLHRSGWLPEDFPGWAISYYDNGAPRGGFVAIKTL